VIKPYIDYGDWLRVKFKLIFFLSGLALRFQISNFALIPNVTPTFQSNFILILSKLISNGGNNINPHRDSLLAMFKGLGPHTCRNREFAGREFASPVAPCTEPSKSRTPMVNGSTFSCVGNFPIGKSAVVVPSVSRNTKLRTPKFRTHATCRHLMVRPNALTPVSH
jgi:hypothetical protein